MSLPLAALSPNAGPATQMFMALIQTLVVTQQSISPPEMWPQNKAAFAKGKRLIVFKL